MILGVCWTPEYLLLAIGDKVLHNQDWFSFIPSMPF